MVFLLSILSTGRLIGLIILIFLLGVQSTAGAAAEKNPSVQQLRSDKVIVLIIDDLGIEDLSNDKLHNFNRIGKSGIVGLMNTRTRSLGSQNRAAAYLTIGMGLRVEALQNWQNTKTLIDNLKRQYPNHISGKLGEVANQNGKTIALLGNSDTEMGQNLALLAAMDGAGSVDSAVMETDSEALLNSIETAVKVNDIIFVDFGDTTRVAEAREKLGLKGRNLDLLRGEALKRADLFLGEIVKIVDKQNAVLLVISPTSIADNKFTGIKNLSPVFIHKKGAAKGVLTSNTTRRDGLISNIDIAPGIFEFLGLGTSKMQFTGEEITVAASVNPIYTIKMNYKNYAEIKMFRYIVHGYYVLLLALIVYLNFLPLIQNRQQTNLRLSRSLTVMIIAIPVISGVTAVMLKDLVAVVVAFNVLLFFTGYMFSAKNKTAISSIAYISLVTSGLIIWDVLNGFGYLLKTPLGFNDVFTGGRYYGINNDLMGILLGSVVFGLFRALERFLTGRSAQIVISAGVMFLVFLSQTPVFGANVGGTIAAIITGAVALIILVTGRCPSIKEIMMVVAGALAAELVVSFTDTLSGIQTHAGKAAASLLSENFTGHLLEIISSKLRVFVAMLLLPPWNLIFFVQLYLYRKIFLIKSSEIKKIEIKSPLVFNSFAIIFCGAGAVFVFNDTGIIAAAMMLIYLTAPLGIMLVKEDCSVNEYGKTITQKI